MGNQSMKSKTEFDYQTFYQYKILSFESSLLLLATCYWLLVAGFWSLKADSYQFSARNE